MNKTIKILTKIGLSEKQAIVYSSLLELGEVSMTEIAQQAKLKRPTVYLVIGELDILGLVSVVTKNKKKIYSAVHPKRISELLTFRKNQYEELLPELLAKYGTNTIKPKVQMLEGLEGLRHAYQEAFTLLKEQKEGLWIGNIELLLNEFPEVLREYDKMLQNLKRYKIREIIYGGDKARDWAKEINSKNKNHIVQYWSDGIFAGATDQLVIGNKTIIFSIKKEIFTLIIESEEIAKTNRAQFENMWKNIR